MPCWDINSSAKNATKTSRQTNDRRETRNGTEIFRDTTSQARATHYHESLTACLFSVPRQCVQTTLFHDSYKREIKIESSAIIYKNQVNLSHLSVDQNFPSHQMKLEQKLIKTVSSTSIYQ